MKSYVVTIQTKPLLAVLLHGATFFSENFTNKNGILFNFFGEFFLGHHMEWKCKSAKMTVIKAEMGDYPIFSII